MRFRPFVVSAAGMVIPLALGASAAFAAEDPSMSGIEQEITNPQAAVGQVFLDQQNENSGNFVSQVNAAEGQAINASRSLQVAIQDPPSIEQEVFNPQLAIGQFDVNQQNENSGSWVTQVNAASGFALNVSDTAQIAQQDPSGSSSSEISQEISNPQLAVGQAFVDQQNENTGSFVGQVNAAQGQAVNISKSAQVAVQDPSNISQDVSNPQIAIGQFAVQQENTNSGNFVSQVNAAKGSAANIHDSTQVAVQH